MNQVEKNEILKQVSSVLQFCQDIVLRLSSSSSPVPKVNNYDINTGMEAAHKELMETNTDPREEEQEHHDIDCENDLWWDAQYPPSRFYTLVFDDDDVSLYSLDETYADFLLPLDMLEDVRLPSDQNNVMEVTNNVINSVKTENVLMLSVLSLLDVAATNAIYDSNWRESQRRKAVQPEFFSLWNSYDSIFTDVKDEDVIISPEAAPEITYHTIDLSTTSTAGLLTIFPNLTVIVIQS